MTKKQRQRRRERKRLSIEHTNTEQKLIQLRSERRRTHARPSRFYAPPNRSWIMVRTMVGRGLRAAADLRRSGVPVFEAKAATRYVTGRGQQREADIQVMKRTLFVGISSFSDLLCLEACIWVEKVLAPGEAGTEWISNDRFRPGWIESETFAGRRMPVITRQEMQRFADHVTGHLRADDEVPDGPPGPAFNVGVNVRVIDGPFASFAGTVESFDPEKATYAVAVNIFGRREDVDLAELALEAA